MMGKLNKAERRWWRNKVEEKLRGRTTLTLLKIVLNWGDQFNGGPVDIRRWTNKLKYNTFFHVTLHFTIRFCQKHSYTEHGLPWPPWYRCDWRDVRADCGCGSHMRLIKVQKIISHWVLYDVYSMSYVPSHLQRTLTRSPLLHILSSVVSFLIPPLGTLSLVFRMICCHPGEGFVFKKCIYFLGRFQKIKITFPDHVSRSGNVMACGCYGMWVKGENGQMEFKWIFSASIW